MSTKSTHLLWVFAIGVGILFLLLVACAKPASTQKIKIGVILPMTGILAEMGQYEKQAMELSQAFLKANGKNNIELIFEDGKGDSKMVAAAANKLLDMDKVRLLIVSTTGASLAARPIAERGSIPLIAFCMGSDVASTSKSTIRYYIGIEEESQAIINNLSSLPKDTHVGVLYASAPVWATAIKDIYQPFFSKQFSQHVLIEEYSLKDKDFRPQLTNFKNAGTQVLVLLGYGFEYKPIFSQMSELRLKDRLKIIGGWGFLYTPLVAQVVEGIQVAGPKYVFDRGQEGKKFENDFFVKYGRLPNFDAAFAYEVVIRLPELIQDIQSVKNEDLKTILANKGDMEGVMGKYHFDQNGNMIIETAVGVFRNGQIVNK
jgi:branched-chain amino acid transport system substrate-binding protein